MKYLIARFNRKGIGQIEKSVIVKIVIYLAVALITIIIGNILNSRLDSLGISVVVIFLVAGITVGMLFASFLGQVQWNNESERVESVKSHTHTIVLILYLLFIALFIIFRANVFAMWFDATQVRVVTMFALCGLMIGNAVVLRARLIRLMRKYVPA